MHHAATLSPLPAGPGTCDPDECQLPMPGLFADVEFGAGSVRLPDEFVGLPSLVQLKVLSDWQRALTRYRRVALQQLTQELSSHSPGLDERQRATLLRSTCASLRIEVPSDFASLAEHA